VATIQLKNVTRRWDHNVVVDDVSVQVADREFLVMLGPSGCGKTTTMRMIAGLDEPTSGEVWIGDRKVNGVPPRERDVAMVFQNYGLYPHMSVAKNIGYPLKVRGVASAAREEAVRAAAAKVDLLPYLDRKPAALSGGQRQRVALARAIVRQPQVFLMDEPLSNLDAKLRATMRAQLRHLQKELAITTVYVTHDQIEAMTLADRVVVMSDGKLQQTGTPLDIYDRPANVFVAGFLGNPAMNLCAGEIVEGAFCLGCARIRRLPFAAQGAVTLGQRPEDMALCAAVEGDLVGVVFSAELLGDSVLVTVRSNDHTFVVRAEKHCRLRSGDTVGLRFDRERLHLFDSASGKRIERTVPSGMRELEVSR